MQRISIKFQEYLIQQNEALAAKATLDQPPQKSPDEWTFSEGLPTAVALEMQLHLTESPKSSSYQFKLFSCMCVCLVTPSCPSLCNPLDYSPPGSSVHGIFQAKIQKKKKNCFCMEWVAISFFRGSSRFSPGDPTWSPALQVDSLLAEPLGSSLFDNQKVLRNKVTIYQ